MRGNNGTVELCRCKGNVDLSDNDFIGFHYLVVPFVHLSISIFLFYVFFSLFFFLSVNNMECVSLADRSFCSHPNVESVLYYNYKGKTVTLIGRREDTSLVGPVDGFVLGCC